MQKAKPHFKGLFQQQNCSATDDEIELLGGAVDDEDTVFLYAIGKYSDKDETLLPLILNNQLTINFKIDVGSQTNVIPKIVFDKLDPKPNLQPTNQ